MAQTFTMRKMTQGNLPFNFDSKHGGMNVTKAVVCSCTGPASSVQAGMVASVASWLSLCQGGVNLGRTGGTLYDVDIEVAPDSAYAPASTKITAIRRSSGTRLTSGIDLSGQTWRVMFLGS